VERRELIHKLDAAATRLILIAAPAGYGKTTLVAQWCSLAASDRSFAWISLDADDNDPITLWRLVIHAIKRVSPTPGIDSLLGSAQGQFPDLTGVILPGLVNELATLPEPVTIAFDDYDLITEPRCHEQVEFLLTHLSANAQIALTARADPPLHLARLRARGDMTEIGVTDLQLTPDEAAGLLRVLSDVELSQQAVAELVERTEGWPTGIYLAALSLRGLPDPSDFVQRFTGSNRYVWDFLAEEVINRQPEQIRQFLRYTSILGRLTARLCDAVTGAPGSREIIAVLDSANLFLIPLDDRRKWYRYHHLFAQTLRSQLSHAEPDIVTVLHKRASEWHRQWGSADEAISHALAAGDEASAVTLMAQHWPVYVDSGRIAILTNWFGLLGDDRISANPLAAHSAAWAAALNGEAELARRLLPVVEAGPPDGPLPDGMRSLQFSAALLMGTFGFTGIRAMHDAAARAVALESDPESPWYSLARVSLGASLYFLGEPGTAREMLESALMYVSPVARVRLLAYAFLCMLALEEGRPRQAQVLAHAARDIEANQTYGLAGAPQGSYAPMALGAVYAAQGRPEDARREFERALQARRRLPGLSPWVSMEISLRLAPVLQELGDAAEAAAVLSEARDVLTAFPDGAEAQLDRLERLEQRLGPQGQAEPGTARLTRREVAVLRSLRGSLSLREIGDELYLSPNTIKSHTRAIYRKLGVSSRQQAIQRAQERGLLLWRACRSGRQSTRSMRLANSSVSRCASRTASPR
jgi:LuxR family maltose regulon positive regulatory protein